MGFINNFGVAAVGLVEVVVVAWLIRELPRLREHADGVSDLRLGTWWLISLGAITPLVLGWMTIDNLLTEFTEPYGGYPVAFLAIVGWGSAALALVVGIAMSRARWPTRLDLGVPTDPADRPGGRS